MPFKHVSAAAFLQSLERSALAFSGPDRAEAIWPKNVKVAHRYSLHLLLNLVTIACLSQQVPGLPCMFTANQFQRIDMRRW
jgi:hypothetical protein